MRGLIFVLLLGWLAGWFSHDYFAPTPEQPEVVASGQRVHTVIPMDVRSDVVKQVEPETQALPVGAVGVEQPSRLQLFQQLLWQDRFDAALAAWPEGSAQQARNIVLAYSGDLRRAGRVDEAIKLLRAYSDVFPEDGEAGLLQADLLHQQQRFRREVFLLMGMISKASGSEIVTRIRSQLQRAVHLYTERLMQSGDYRDLLDFYRQLSNLDGGNQHYNLMQVTILIEMGLLPEAVAMLQPLQFDPAVREQAKALAATIERIRASHYQVSLPLQRSGDHFLVPVSINGNAPVNLLLDTGASITLVQGLEASDGNDKHKQITLQTANGQLQVPVITVDEVSLAGFHLHGVQLGLLAEPVAAGAAGLLGMNILKQFDFFIDQQAPALKLTLRKPSAR